TFDDSFTPSWSSWLPAAGMLGLGVWAVIADRFVVWRIVNAAALVLVAAATWQILGGRAADLVEGRRRFRLVLALGSAAAIAVFAILTLIPIPGFRIHGGPVSAGIVLALAVTSAMFRLGVRHPPVPAPQSASASTIPRERATTIEPDDRLALDR